MYLFSTRESILKEGLKLILTQDGSTIYVNIISYMHLQWLISRLFINLCLGTDNQLFHLLGP